MELTNRLMLLLDVIEHGSFASVAEHRNVDRSVISKQIAKLEEELEVRLLHRTTRSLSLTAAGLEVVDSATILREQLQDTIRIAQNYHQTPKGKLKITCPHIFGRRFVQAAISHFQDNYPDVEFELRLEDRIVDMIGEGFDLGFRVGEPKDSSLIARMIARNRMLIVASPQFLKHYGEPQSQHDLEKLPAAVYASTGLITEKIKFYDEKNQLSSIQLNTAYKANEGDVLIDAAISGKMFAVVAAHMIQNEIKDGLLQPIMTHICLADFGAFYAMYPHRDSPMKVKLFIDELKKLINDQYPTWEKNIPNFSNMYGYKNNLRQVGYKKKRQCSDAS
ncbi:LysR family transcriptional regulator [Pseudoalteromonas citrea]|uniref:LysR family transcriptional regulator n=1 Tax=Pseudoalteromonas citrea TaxID=43655 RepID=A0A5S3XME4_9GAMM|nr:LysR family transcriptional regulator [Pseudoalteromonas citrea]TMP39169.1 LysR family transcriptional regulator [Pseudoalteromonas citrea]TMP57166.1 LysR family transcriptional regulator [Pseudoalteromonas citrea]